MTKQEPQEPAQAEPVAAAPVLAMTAREWGLRYSSERERVNDGEIEQNSTKGESQ